MRIIWASACRLFVPLLLCTTANQINAADIESSNIGPYDFSLANVEKNCAVNRYSGNNLEIICEPSNMKVVDRDCEGFITGGLDETSLNCRGALWEITQRCKIEMRSSTRGVLNCRL